MCCPVHLYSRKFYLSYQVHTHLFFAIMGGVKRGVKEKRKALELAREAKRTKKENNEATTGHDVARGEIPPATASPSAASTNSLP